MLTSDPNQKYSVFRVNVLKALQKQTVAPGFTLHYRHISIVHEQNYLTLIISRPLLHPQMQNLNLMICYGVVFIFQFKR